jgi:cation diffusion facilitator CzcD-associated flavoprotein CzcO
MSETDQIHNSPSAREPVVELDAVVVGAGFAGLYMLYRLRGMGLSVRVFEAGGGIGGTWYWNRYPGARCDVESMEYSYQFSEELQQEWQWSEQYSSQPEILRYVNHVADRFDLRKDIQFDTRVLSAQFDEATSRWNVVMDDGGRVSARYCVLATGCLSSANIPEIHGLDEFGGDWYHTGNWPHEAIDFTGKRVAVIGTGSSAIQAIPAIAEQAEHVTVFQRTANYSVPGFAGPIDPADEQRIKANYAEFRKSNSNKPFGAAMELSEDLAMDLDEDARTQRFEEQWNRGGGLPFLGSFADLITDPAANTAAADFIRNKIRAIVDDPAVAELLAPQNTFGCKRLCVDTGYYETYNRPNVSLVDISKTGVDRINPDGIRANDQDYQTDALVFATGFDAMTGALLNIDICGSAGVRLKEKWAHGPRAYLGLGISGFPNMFIITGPGSPSVLTNMLPSIEQHVDWIADCIEHLRTNNLAKIEPQAEAEDAWLDTVNEVASETLFTTCNSWYLGSNIPGKKRVFMPYIGYPPYVEKCEEVVANGYEGFVLTD